MRLITIVAALMLALTAASAGARADCAHPLVVRSADGDSMATVASGTAYCYQFAAQTGQQLSIGVTSPENDVVFAVFAPGWTTSCNAAGDCDVVGDQLSDDEVKNWADTAPAAGNYLIVIDNSRSDADYELSISVR